MNSFGAEGEKGGKGVIGGDEKRERGKGREGTRQRGDSNERKVRLTKLIASQRSSLINEATDV